MATRREMLRLTPGLAALLCVSVAGCAPYYPAYYEYPPPPAPWSPNMVWMPSPGAYVALGYNYPLFYYGGSYYSNYGRRWYSGPTYHGPWHHRPGPPPRLHGFQPGAWGGYQARARGYYRGNPGWRHFRPPR
jgi:hypothetical protein